MQTQVGNFSPEQKAVRDKFVQTANQYADPRQAGDIDLVAWVRNELSMAGLEQEAQAGYDVSPMIIDASTRRPDVQRYILNRFWNLQLMCYASESIDQRFCLVPNGQIEEWMKLFKSMVLPFLIVKRLPIYSGL